MAEAIISRRGGSAGGVPAVATATLTYYHVSSTLVRIFYIDKDGVSQSVNSTTTQNYAIIPTNALIYIRASTTTMGQLYISGDYVELYRERSGSEHYVALRINGNSTVYASRVEPP